MSNYFNDLNVIDLSKHKKDKNGLTYVSWVWAWGELKKKHPDASYTVYENAEGWNYHTDGKTCWVKTGVTIDGLEHIEYLPVMDFRNKSIPAENITSFEVNKAIQRSITKCIARHGLGLYVYANEDLPEFSPFDTDGMDRKEKEETLSELCKIKGKTEKVMCSWASVKSFAEMTDEQLDNAIGMLNV